MSGHNEIDESGDYGTKGVPADSNRPGARERSISWIDASGDLWLFGGHGFDSNEVGYLNDLWRYEMPDGGDNGTWTWMSGHNEISEYGRYGTKGVPADSNRPGARDRSISWIDDSGAFWLFGGEGYDADNNTGYLNDLWRYEPDIGDNGTWTWMSGHNEVDKSGDYGTKGVPADSNRPGARRTSISWIDESGALWLFGGNGFDSNNDRGYLNDLWRYEPDSGMWTWMSGHNEISEGGLFGTKGVPADNNRPGARSRSISWIDESGDLWLFSGDGLGRTTWGYLNDLWRYEVPDCLHDGGCPSGRCLNNICVGCVEDDQCFNSFCVASVCVECRNNDDCNSGVCENNVCIECSIDADCDNEEYCDGAETCDNRTGECVPGIIPCAGGFCDEAEDICMECTEDNDCFGWFCEENICVECIDETNCDNELFCDGAETCDAGVCTAGTDPCPNEACDEMINECVECRGDYDCADMYMCQSALCVPRCELTIKHKALSVEKLLKKGKKLGLSITGGKFFDPSEDIDAGGFTVLKPKSNTKKGKLKFKLEIPKDTGAQTIPIRVGECMGEVEIQ
jgi:hypothetical protein